MAHRVEVGELPDSGVGELAVGAGDVEAVSVCQNSAGYVLATTGNVGLRKCGGCSECDVSYICTHEHSTVETVLLEWPIHGVDGAPGFP